MMIAGMKTIIAVCAAAIVASGVGAIAASPGTAAMAGRSTSGGRYQLFQGSFTNAVENASVPGTEVFKIDTETGRSWIFISGLTTDKKLISAWREIER